MDYFELHHEDREDYYGWLKNHRYDFICNIYDRIWYGVDNDLDRVKLFITMKDGKPLMRWNLRLESLKGGTYLNTILREFEDVEDYEGCRKVLELKEIINQKY